MHSIFDHSAVSAHAEMYQAWAAPDLFPGQPQPRLSTWHPEDLAVYIGRLPAAFRNARKVNE